jgi:hypothetical protein
MTFAVNQIINDPGRLVKCHHYSGRLLGKCLQQHGQIPGGMLAVQIMDDIRWVRTQAAPQSSCLRGEITQFIPFHISTLNQVFAALRMNPVLEGKILVAV